MILPQAFADHRAAAPETIRVAAAVLPAGDHTIEVQAVGSSTRSHTITVAIPLAAATDIVTIFSPKYMKGTLRLTVKATSSAQPNAVLTVLGYGTVTYNAKKKEDTFQGTVDSAPATVTVQSSKGGIATMAAR